MRSLFRLVRFARSLAMLKQNLFEKLRDPRLLQEVGDLNQPSLSRAAQIASRISPAHSSPVVSCQMA